MCVKSGRSQLRELQHKDFGIMMLERMEGGLPALINATCNYGECGEQLLAEYEMDALIDVLLTCLATLGWGDIDGSLVVYTQVHDQDLVLNLSAGVRRMPYAGGVVPVGGAREQTLKSAQEALWTKLDYANHVNCLPYYYMGGLMAAVALQTDVGYFSIAFDRKHSDEDIADYSAVFGAIAQTLACMRMEDAVLQDACAELNEELRRVGAYRGLAAMEMVKELFSDALHPIVKEWRKGPPLGF